MEQLSIKILTKNESKFPFKEFETSAPSKPATLKGIAVLEGATVGTRTGVSLCFTDNDGNTFFCNTTARIILGAASAIRGAMQRFGDDPDKA